MLSIVGRTSCIYRPFRPIALGLSGLFAIGVIGLNHRLRKPEVIGFASLIDHNDVQFKLVGIGPPAPPTPTKVDPTDTSRLGAMYGANIMTMSPRWAPSRLFGLEGRIKGDMT